jgi:O-antigen/teichoic acid export membrane protein
VNDTDERVDLRLPIVRGLAWTGIASVVGQASRLIFGVALARLLTPHEYGIAGMALVFAALVLAVSDFGLGAGLVQRPRISEKDRSTVFWASLAIGAVLTGIGLALSGTVAAFFDEPAVAPLFAAVAVGFVVTALGRVHSALLQRSMAFRAIALRGIAATIIGGVVGVSLAALDHGPWALVGMHLANGVVTTVLLWFSVPWRPGLAFSLRSLRDLGGFGLNVLGARIIDYLNSSVDKLLVGRVLGPSPLGFYNVTYNFLLVPFGGLLTGVLEILFSAFSRVQDDRGRIATMWIRASRSITAVTAPAMLGVVVVAPDAVAVVLGDRWSGAVPILQVLALAPVVYSVTTVSTVVLLAVDRASSLFRFSIAEVALVVPAVSVGLIWGVVGVGAAFVLAITCTRAILTWLATRALGVSVGMFLRAFAGVGQAALTMFVVVWVARAGLVAAGVSAAPRLVVLVLAGALVYLLVSLWRAPELLADVRFLRTARTAGALS